MTTYRITSKAGGAHGIWDADSPAEALLALLRDAGYGENTVWVEDDHLTFSDDGTPQSGATYREMCGDLDDWLIEEVE